MLYYLWLGNGQYRQKEYVNYDELRKVVTIGKFLEWNGSFLLIQLSRSHCCCGEVVIIDYYEIPLHLKRKRNHRITQVW